MKKQSVLFAAAVACTLLPSAAFAACTTSGTVVEVFVYPSGATIYVRHNTPGATTYSFTTTVPSLQTAALIAQSSHMHVSAQGNATACGAVAGGLSAGGVVNYINVAP